MWQWTYQDYKPRDAWRVQGTRETTAAVLSTRIQYGPNWWDPSPDSEWPSYQLRIV